MKIIKSKTNFSKSHLSVFLIVFAVLGLILLIQSLAAPNPNLPGDLNNDNSVNIQDLSILLSNYGTSNTTADINGDGTVNILDLSVLLSHYGESYTGGGGSSGTTLHYAANTGGNISAAAAMGFNLFDVAGSTTNPTGVNTTVNALPAGSKALIWVGNLDNAPIGATCPAPGFSYAQFTAQVDALKNNPNVYGYYISDEPHPSVCPTAVPDIKARADYIHANAPSQKSFIIVLDGTNSCGGTLGCEFNSLQPANTDLDLFGLDPYPCHYDTSLNPVPCDLSMLTQRIQSAISNGIPASSIIPVYQAFGQAGRIDGKTVYYRLPTADELTSMINAFANFTPKPAFDYPYTFGVQCTSSSCPAPQALINSPDLQPVIQTHNGS